MKERGHRHTMTGTSSQGMDHRTVHEWKKLPIGKGEEGFTRAQADSLLAAARSHAKGGAEGQNILVEQNRHLHARQAVGILAGQGCSLEILPKIEPADGESDASVRARLVHMLDVALDLDISHGEAAAMARQDHKLLDILIRIFADRLLAEARRGLPSRYNPREDDLPALRGRLDVARQFTINAVRPDRLSCRYDSLEADTPLMRVMKACTIMLHRHARLYETQRRLAELRFLMADVPDVQPSRLPWDRVVIDRRNRRWRSLFAMAKLFLKRDWQATHHQTTASDGITLLFPMNDLFEAYVAAGLRKQLREPGIEVVAQGGLEYCLGHWREGEHCHPSLFQTRPDIILRDRSTGRARVIIDTKWKKLASDPFDRKRGVKQGDVYQLMAYARLYRCDRLMLLYPSVPGAGEQARHDFGLALGRERLAVSTVDISEPKRFAQQLAAIISAELSGGDTINQSDLYVNRIQGVSTA